MKTTKILKRSILILSLGAILFLIFHQKFYWTRRLTSPFYQTFAPRYGTCYRCKMPWRFIKSHDTAYSETKGCFPLCEHCWQDLTPQERLPYYHQLFESWKQWEEQPDEKWIQIKKAVMAGK